MKKWKSKALAYTFALAAAAEGCALDTAPEKAPVTAIQDIPAGYTPSETPCDNREIIENCEIRESNPGLTLGERDMVDKVYGVSLPENAVCVQMCDLPDSPYGATAGPRVENGVVTPEYNVLFHKTGLHSGDYSTELRNAANPVHTEENTNAAAKVTVFMHEIMHVMQGRKELEHAGSTTNGIPCEGLECYNYCPDDMDARSFEEYGLEQQAKMMEEAIAYILYHPEMVNNINPDLCTDMAGIKDIDVLKQSVSELMQANFPMQDFIDTVTRLRGVNVPPPPGYKDTAVSSSTSQPGPSI
ncbi:MAG: hypothetical protein OXT65_07090 [Alphaproteobacteria bacterium]|nr:hypothetical protein [Alphaproteobacteria bacterium]